MRLLLIAACILSSFTSIAQAYTPMPSDSAATWRYRMYDTDDGITTIYDLAIFENRGDTTVLGHTYHKLYSRTHIQNVPVGTDPPIVSCNASLPDVYYGAIRDSAQEVYWLSGFTENLIYNFHASVGDFVPAHTGTKKVNSIDSIVVGGTYHKRYHTTDTGFSPIEGIGSTRGLNPQFNDGSGDIVFHCFSDNSLLYSPNGDIPCTTVYSILNSLGVLSPTSKQAATHVYPNPASDIVHIVCPAGEPLQATISNAVGAQVWSRTISGNTAIPISSWPKGVYVIRISGASINEVRRIVIE